MESSVTVRERWLSAICYVPLLVFVAILAGDKSPFLARHCRQGFAVLLAEVVGIVFISIVDVTLGLVPVLGFLLVILLRLVFFLVVLVVSVLGFTRAIFGETWRIPYVDELADRIPIQ